MQTHSLRDLKKVNLPVVSAKPGEKTYVYEGQRIGSICTVDRTVPFKYVWQTMSTMIHQYYSGVTVERERAIREYLGYPAVFWRRDQWNRWKYIEDSRISEAYTAVLRKESLCKVEEILYF